MNHITENPKYHKSQPPPLEPPPWNSPFWPNRNDIILPSTESLIFLEDLRAGCLAELGQGGARAGPLLMFFDKIGEQISTGWWFQSL